MIYIGGNCGKCPDYLGNKCDGKDGICMCRRCPRNLGKCIITKYCSETESILDVNENIDI